MNYIFELLSNGLLYIILIELVFIACKTYFLRTLFIKKIKSIESHKAWLFLAGVLFFSLLVDISWITFACYRLFPNPSFKPLAKLIMRFCWGGVTLQYVFLALFIVSLIEKRFAMKWYYYCYGFIGSFIALYCFADAFLASGWGDPRLLILILGATSTITAIIGVSRKINQLSLPTILKKQFSWLRWLIILFTVIDMILPLLRHFVSFLGTSLAINVHFWSVPLLMSVILFSSRRMIGMRFLNYEDHVKSTEKYAFLEVLKTALARLGAVFKPEELPGVVADFFHESMGIKKEAIKLYIRKSYEETKVKEDDNSTEALIEHVLKSGPEYEELIEYMYEKRILICDEIEFSDFYEDRLVLKKAVSFLRNIKADIFIPIFDQRQIINGYLIVAEHARPAKLYNDVERDEMLIFASYLGHVIYLFQHKNLDVVIQREKELSDELYTKQQEIAQYQECIRSFARSAQEQRKIGLLFYKNKRFVFANQAANDLVPSAINTQHGHPLAKALKQIVKQVEDTKVSQSCFASDVQGSRIVITALPHVEQNNIILMVNRPEVSDIVNKYLEVLKDHSERDYLLYLETTKTGQLISKLIPGSGASLLKFKVELLKTALSKKATLLELVSEDALTIAEILHLISCRQDMHVLKLQGPVRNYDIVVKLVGINPLFGATQSTPLLQQLNETGTLYIENIHWLDLDTQKYLADFIKYGFYKVYKSEQRVVSSVRIIASTTHNLATLVQEGKFLQELLDELKKTSLSMPSLLTLPETEFMDLAQGFSEQVIQEDTYKNLLELTESEKNKLVVRRPATILEFKTRIQNLLVSKSKRSHIYDVVHFDPAYNINDPELAQAARLGKHALRDAKIMTMLWHKFKNQSKIATFLGVNRSSVNRKMKDFNIV
jgi:predicted XRE-type DNA-binding protein